MFSQTPLMQQKYFEIIATIIVFVVLLALKAIFKSIIRKHAVKYDLDIAQKKYTTKFFNTFLFVLLIVTLSIVWQISMKGLTIYFASFFAIVGVALFANWSILSNITSSIILFFNYPFKIGSEIEILDHENTIKGTVVDITFFSIQILSKDGHVVSYPNNLAIQKPIKHIKK
jgi:MscS family membrane protein